VRVLFIAPYLPTHGSGGRTRFVNFLEQLGARHDIRVVAFRAPDQTDDHDPSWRAFPPPSLRPRPGGMRGRIRFFREKLEPLPAYAGWFHDEAFAAAVTEEIATFRPDVVQVETTEMGQYLPPAQPGLVRALDLQDVASRWFTRVAKMGATRRQRALMRVEMLKARRYERACARGSEVVLVCSEAEQRFLQKVSGVTARLVPNGVDVAGFAPQPEVPEEPNTVLFVGPLAYAANSDGLMWFAKRVLPLIKAEIPDVVVEHVGAADAHPYPGITHRGMVPDVRPHLAAAPVSIVPVRIGTGTRYKILEALSMERAVVSTAVGAEGLGLRTDEHIRIADDPKPFAAAVVDLLRDAEQRARLGKAGREHVAARFDWSGIVARVEEAWEIGRGKPRS
jgi:polysaccharide biosynthesis protein PslH